MRWDPQQYSRFAGPRNRPYYDLIAQIDTADPTSVVDLGCGSGALTATLPERWPHATIRGIDSSPDMIAAAPTTSTVTFHLGTAEDFDATGTDVLITNATLQWVPRHTELVPRWISQLAPGGWLAFQIPANFDAPSHALMRELATSPRWRAKTDGARDRLAVRTPDDYLDLVTAAGLDANVWQTEYLHVLPGPDPVLEWVKGTGLRPILAALTPDDATAFSDEYAQLLRAAYPERPYGTVLGFRRTFVVGHTAP